VLYLKIIGYNLDFRKFWITERIIFQVNYRAAKL